MNVVSACPDTLLVGARNRSLSAEDQARLDAHLVRCADCRATLEVGRAFDAGLGARPGDDEIARRIAARLTPTKQRRKFPVWLAVAAVFVTGSVAAATVPTVWNVVGIQFSPPVPSLTVPVL